MDKKRGQKQVPTPPAKGKREQFKEGGVITNPRVTPTNENPPPPPGAKKTGK